MKSFLLLFSLFCLLSCQNDIQSNQNQANTLTQQGVLAQQMPNDPCSGLSFKPDYAAERRQERTFEVQEGQETFRVAPNTVTDSFYVQRKVGNNCWETTDTFQCWQFGLYLENDINDDGFLDITIPWKYYESVAFYMPENKRFSAETDYTSRVSNLLEKVKFDIRVNGDERRGDVRSRGTNSSLFRYKGYEEVVFASLEILNRQIKGDEQNPDNYAEAESIKLYAIKEGKSVVIQEWNPKDLKAFWKNNDDGDYFDDDAFIEDYWKKNWRKYVPK